MGRASPCCPSPAHASPIRASKKEGSSAESSKNRSRSAQHVPVRPSSCLSYISCPMCLCLYPWSFLHTSLPDINKGRPHSGPSLFYAYFHLIYHNFCRYLFSTSLCFYESETALFRLYSSITATISLLFWMLFCSSASSTLWSESG